MKPLKTLLDIGQNVVSHRLFWAVLFVVSLFKAEAVVQILILIVAVAGFEVVQNWLIRVSKAYGLKTPKGTYQILEEAASQPPQGLREKLLIAVDDVNKLLQIAQHLILAGQFHVALAIAEKAAELNPQNFETNFLLGYLYDLSPINLPEKAVQYSERALELKPRDFLSQFNLAVATNHVDGSAKSLNEFLKAESYAKEQKVDMDSETMGKLNLFLADDYKNTGQYAEAEPRYKKADEILSRLVEKGDRTSQHWLTAARKRREELG